MKDDTALKILFIIPLNDAYERIVEGGKTPWKSKQGFGGKIAKVDCVYPSGVLSIASYLKKHFLDIEVKILDLNAAINRLARDEETSFEDFSFEDFLESAFSFLGDYRPDVIGVSALFVNVYRDLKPLASFLRRRYPRSLSICGGHIPSSLFRRIFDDEIEFDAIAFGEGEIPCLQLVRAVREGKSMELLETDASWITPAKLQRELLFKPENKLLTDLDEIPPYDLDSLVFPDVYFSSMSFLFAIDPRVDQKEVLLFSTRGCPYHCIFCASQNVHGHKVRFYSLKRMKKDVDYYHDRYGITRFVFYDDHFLVDKKHAVELLHYIAQKGFDAEIPNPPFFSIDRNVADAMKRVGIKEVILTIESGNEDTFKKIMRKPSNLQKAAQAVDILHDAGIMVFSNILIGLPGETKKSIEVGLEYLKKTKINWFMCFVTAPLPGSELYRICEENGYFATESDPVTTMDFKKCVIRTPDFEPEYIDKKCYEMNLTLNFVNNYDMRAGNYDKALTLFERIFRSVTAHAFAYYFAAKCCKALNMDEKYAVYKTTYEDCIVRHPFWADQARQYRLPPLD